MCLKKGIWRSSYGCMLLNMQYAWHYHIWYTLKMMCDMCGILGTQQGYLINYTNQRTISIVSRNLANETKNEQKTISSPAEIINVRFCVSISNQSKQSRLERKYDLCRENWVAEVKAGEMHLNESKLWNRSKRIVNIDNIGVLDASSIVDELTIYLYSSICAMKSQLK